MLRGVPNPDSRRLKGRVLLAFLLAAAVLMAACQGGGNRSTSDPGSYPTTVNAPVEQDLSSCPTPPAFTAGPAGAADWPTYHRANDRHGVATGSPSARGLNPQWAVRLDGPVFTQPLIVQHLTVVATQSDTVYAFDTESGCLAWKASLGQPVDATKQPCPGPVTSYIGSQLGVLSTPVADAATGTLYVVPYLSPPSFEMVALDLATGTVRWRRPLDLPQADLPNQLSRPALTLANGRVYAGFGGRAGSCGKWHGYLVGVRADGQGTPDLYQSPGFGGSFWFPGGLVVLPSGELLATSSEGSSTKAPDDGDTVLRLSPDLKKQDGFTPSNWADLNRADNDLGSVGPTLLAGNRVFQVGKEGVGYLLDAGRLGGVGGQLFSKKLDGGCYAIGTTAYQDPYVYVPCDHGLKAVQVKGKSFDVAWTAPDFRAGSPMVAGGVVWSVDFEKGYLWSLDPRSGQVKQKAAIGTARHFVSPSFGAGRLFVPVGQRLVSFSFK
ncbi:PQQ-binding-like beta-propeller repeat protein [Candidatus Nephthysia bennettiae]|uniref:PQQ-binding-like beta-propeller repeat protein n=1 Tax=Candidatus Nephthysia bennettiae TaxID=3127016 RepID=A0A934K9H8_9BACT|nr:PQQ-binding-like beta-propeller repeat protein [Candidatus Dormibacteraeota bacterium]